MTNILVWILKYVVAIVVLNMKCFPHSLLCLNTGSPAGGITWEGYGAFRRESLDRRSELWGSTASPHLLFPLCFLHVSAGWLTSLPLTIPAGIRAFPHHWRSLPCPDGPYPSGTVNKKQTLLFQADFVWDLCHSNRKETEEVGSLLKSQW